MSRKIDRPSVPPLTVEDLAERDRSAREAQREDRRRTGRRRRMRPRSRSIPVKKITRAVIAAEAFVTTLVPDEVFASRPRTRGECRDDINGERPCPWVSCKHHLYLDINPETGSIKINFPDLEPWELENTCSIDVAERGGITLEEVGEIMNLTRERIRQVEVRGLLALKLSPTIQETT